MILIVEGLDSTGKSTLIKNLRKTYFKNPKTIVLHSSVPPDVDSKKDWEVDHYFHLFEHVDGADFIGYDVILDRAHLGAVVYGDLYRGGSSKKIMELEKTFHWDEPYSEIALLLLTDSPDSGWSRDDGNSVETDISQYKMTREKFIEVFNKSSIHNKLHIDVTENGGFANTLPSVIKFLEEIKNEEDF